MASPKSIHDLLEIAIERHASDLLLKAGSPPALRVDGNHELATTDVLTFQDTEELVHSIIAASTRDYLVQMGTATSKFTGEQMLERKVQALHDMEEIDVAFTIEGLARVRSNLFLQRNTVGAALRIIPTAPQTIEELNLPPILKDWSSQPKGLIIVTGPTGSGKSTTVSAMIEHINSTRQCHIITIEDPVEHIFEDKQSFINQREVGSDTKTHATALRSVLRQIPDVIMIGEMRDVDTIDVAITAGEVGHLVITTLHTTSAAVTIDRILNSFPPDGQRQIAIQLAASLIGVTSQRLVHRKNGKGRLPAMEIMAQSPTVKKLIEEEDTAELYAAIREGAHFGMNTMNQCLESLHQADQIAYDEAMLHAGDTVELKQMLRRA